MPAKATKAAISATEPATEEPAEPAATPAPKKKAKAVRSQPATAAAAADERGAGAARTDEAEARSDAGAARSDEGADEFVPMNRAERRAKGRPRSLSQAPGGRGKVSGSHGPVFTQRNWA